MKMIILWGIAILAVFVGRVCAQERLDARGLDGREQTVISLFHSGRDLLFVGTGDGLFVKDVARDAAFRRVRGIPYESCRVNEIYVSGFYPGVLAATERGLFSINASSLRVRQEFTRSDPAERACVSVAMLEGGAMIVATRAGLFVRRQDEAEWLYLAVPFDGTVPARLYGAKGVFYAAVQDGVYRSVDLGISWERVFDAVSAAPGSGEEVSSGEEVLGDIERRIVDIAGLEADPDVMCLATSFGVFRSRDRARTWQTLPLSGLDYTSARDVMIHPVSREVLCLTRSGLYVLKADSWVQLALVYDGRSMAGFGTEVLYVTKAGIYVCDPSRSLPGADIHAGAADVSAYIHEPTIEEVQRMATDYAEVSNNKIKDWRRRASMRAFLPDLSLDYDKVIYGSSSGAFATGPRDWGVSLKWELGDLVYNPDQTTIDTRSKLMVQLRNDILAEVTRLYFERRRLQIDMAVSSGTGEEGLERELRIQETTALINRLTGGHFERVLKSMH